MNVFIERITDSDYLLLELDKDFPFYKTEKDWKNFTVSKKGIEQNLHVSVGFCRDSQSANRLFNRVWLLYGLSGPDHEIGDMIIMTPAFGRYNYILFRDGNIVYSIITAKNESNSFDDIMDFITHVALRENGNAEALKNLIQQLTKEKIAYESAYGRKE